MGKIELGKTRSKLPIKQIYILDKILTPGDILPLPRAIYMYMAIIFKHLFHINHLANQRQILCGASLGIVNINFVKAVARSPVPDL